MFRYSEVTPVLWTPKFKWFAFQSYSAMTEVEIEYCVPCGLLDRAIEVEKSLLEEFGQDLEAVRLKTGDGGVFKVMVDDELVYDKDEEGYDEDRLKDRVQEHL